MATAEDIYKKHRPQAFDPDRRPSSTEVDGDHPSSSPDRRHVAVELTLTEA